MPLLVRLLAVVRLLALFAGNGRPLLLLACLLTTNFVSLPRVAWGGALVLANRTTNTVRVQANSPRATPRFLVLKPGDIRPLWLDGKIRVRFNAGRSERSYELEPDSAHFFGTNNNHIDLFSIGLGAPDVSNSEQASHDWARSILDTQPIYRVPVKVLVDDDVLYKRSVWEPELRKRIRGVSKVIEKVCFVRFQVVAVGTWDSDDNVHDFSRSLREFEHEVEPGKARLAIGFTSQYSKTSGRTNLGGTHGPMLKHILLREWSNHLNQAERDEILVHELGHFLGATHSPEQESVMRPVLGDKRARLKSYRVRFDPINTLILAMVSEQMRLGRVDSFSQLPTPTKLKLRRIYQAVEKTLPKDPAAARFVRILENAGATPVAAAARRVVQRIVRTAEINRNLPLKGTEKPGEVVRFEKDRLTELYFRQGAKALKDTPADIAWKAYVIGLAVALDRSQLLQNSPLGPRVSPLYRAIESKEERQYRLGVLGNPTMHGRADLAQHFSVAAALSILIGTRTTEALAVMKEVSDAKGSSGFSFADLSADVAGIVFTNQLRSGKLKVKQFEGKFAIEDFLPPPDGFVEQLSWQQFKAQYGSILDSRFLAQRDALRAQIERMPGYAELTSGPNAGNGKSGERR